MTSPLVTTALSFVDGDNGVLAYRGVRLEDVVAEGYVAAAARLLSGAAADADAVGAQLIARPMPAWAGDVLAAAPSSLPPMARLRLLVAALADAGSAYAGSADAGSADAGSADAGSAYAGSADAGSADAGSAYAGSADAGSQDDDLRAAGLYGRLVGLLGPGPQGTTTRTTIPTTTDGYVASILRGVRGSGAGSVDSGRDDDGARDDVALLGACFVVHLDHALNPGTLAVRTAASTGASLSACVSAGLGALEGPLHGGASSAVGALLADVSGPAAVDATLDALAARRARVPGFGHPVYRRHDPRAAVLRGLCERAAARHGHSVLDVATALETRVVERSAGRLFANVDFYAAALYATLGIPLQLHTPLFFAARVVGWLAHVREQRAQRRVISPEAGYDGLPLAPATGPR
jgi:citrate synthase